MAFTFFFRDQHTLSQTVNSSVGEFMGRSSIRIWNAGCAMGMETYTMAMLFAEKMGYFSFKNLKIDATDIDDETNSFGNTVMRGVYSYDDLKRIPESFFDKYFEPAPEGAFRIIDPIRQRVRFSRHDLLSLKPVGEAYSVIICKNVLLHFSAQERARVVGMFHQTLAPGGFFTMEQTQEMPAEHANSFRKVVPDAQVFQKVN